MQRFLDRRAAALLLAAIACGALAQSQDSVPPAGDPAPGQVASGAIQGQSIFEVKRDAASEPGYLAQGNGQRNRVQPGNNAPLWRGVQAGMQGTSSLPKSQAPEAGILIQAPVQYPGTRFVTAGEGWRELRNRWLIPYGGSLLVIVLLALGIFYRARGPLGSPETVKAPRRIERFTPFERAAHWANASAFLCLAGSGIVMGYGKFFLLPVLGHSLFGYLTYLSKILHNFTGPLFAVSLTIVFFTFLRDNFPQSGDVRWLLRMGGMLGAKELPSHRFNAGEKLVFWIGVLMLGAAVVGSGLVLDKLVPQLGYQRHTMQVTHIVHNLAAVLMLLVFFGHIYIGTIGMRGAYAAMRDGHVNDAWAREHHAYWYAEVKDQLRPAGMENTKVAPGPSLGSAHRRPA